MNVIVAGNGRPFLDGDSLDHRAPLVFTIDGVLDADECAQQIALVEQVGPTVAPITTADGPVMRTDIRNNTRVMRDDAALAQRLYERIAGTIPQRLCDMHPVGANERFRYYKYTPGQRFAPHFDGAFFRDDDEQSLLTFMVYLNDGFGGGATTFHDDQISVVPCTGSALFFQHRQLHEGCAVTSGVKYVLRTDVMYRR